jgi:hypothetical protein
VYFLADASRSYKQTPNTWAMLDRLTRRRSARRPPLHSPRLNGHPPPTTREPKEASYTRTPLGMIATTR